MNPSSSRIRGCCPTCGRLIPGPNGESFTARVVAYVEAHPGSTVRDVRMGLEAPSLRVRSCLYQLVRLGRLRRKYAPRSTSFFPVEGSP